MLPAGTATFGSPRRTATRPTARLREPPSCLELVRDAKSPDHVDAAHAAGRPHRSWRGAAGRRRSGVRAVRPQPPGIRGLDLVSARREAADRARARAGDPRGPAADRPRAARNGQELPRGDGAPRLRGRHRGRQIPRQSRGHPRRRGLCSIACARSAPNAPARSRATAQRSHPSRASRVPGQSAATPRRDDTEAHEIRACLPAKKPATDASAAARRLDRRPAAAGCGVVLRGGEPCLALAGAVLDRLHRVLE